MHEFTHRCKIKAVIMPLTPDLARLFSLRKTEDTDERREALTYIIDHNNPGLQSRFVTPLCYVCYFLHEWWDLQFIVEFERHIREAFITKSTERNSLYEIFSLSLFVEQVIEAKVLFCDTKEVVSKVFRWLKKSWYKYIISAGDYFEGDKIVNDE